MRGERGETVRHLLQAHRELSERVRHYTSPGHGAPGFVSQLQNDLRGIEGALVGLCAAGEERSTVRSPRSIWVRRRIAVKYIMFRRRFSGSDRVQCVPVIFPDVLVHKNGWEEA